MADETFEQTFTAEAAAQSLNERLSSEFSDEDRANLSKILFPDTDNREIELLGIKRTLRPLPLKFSKQLNAATTPFAVQIADMFQNPEEKDIPQDSMNTMITDVLNKVALICCDYYGWDDVRAAVSKEELSITELQQLCVTQQEVNGKNDFLFGPLRIATTLMQTAEMITNRFSSSVITQQLLKTGDVASTS